MKFDNVSFVLTTFGTPRGDGRLESSANKSYRPSNGTAGEVFQTIVCGTCANYQPKEDMGDDCTLDIIFTAMCVDRDAPTYPKEWVFDPKGDATCTAWKFADRAPRNSLDLLIAHDVATRDQAR